MSRSTFNVRNQNQHLDSKIVAGLERLSEAFKVLLWEKAKTFGLSPIQIQLLIFLNHHSEEHSTVSYLSKEFNVTKPTISDAVKSLEQKKLIEKFPSSKDTRSYTIKLTDPGTRLIQELESYTQPIENALDHFDPPEKIQLWETLSNLIFHLNRAGVVQVQRMCFNCAYYQKRDSKHFCGLLNTPLLHSEIRLDCPDHATK